MNPALSSRLQTLGSEIKALASGSWTLFRQEMSGKAEFTRRQTILMAAGALTALTAILLVLAGLTLLLAQLLVSRLGWEPMTAGGVAALTVAVCFALTGWLVFRSSANSLKTRSLKPDQTIQSLRTAAAALTNQPLIPPTPTPMKTRQEFNDALHHTADSVEYQARRAARAVQDTASSLSQKLDPGPFFASALAWVDAVMTPQNRALAGKALTAVSALPRRHPVFSAALALGGIYLLRNRDQSIGRRVDNYVSEARGYADDLRRTAAQGYQATVEAGRDIGGAVTGNARHFAESGRQAAAQFNATATRTAERVRGAYEDARTSVAEGMDHLSETAQQLRKDAEAGYRKAKEFAKEEPALAIAGGVALAIGALLLVKSSRR